MLVTKKTCFMCICMGGMLDFLPGGGGGGPGP